MPARVATARKAVGVLRTPTSALWITDDILQSAFERFTSSRNPACKRHGSNIPGPLEAARRETRRRRYGIALGRDITPAVAAAAMAQDVSAAIGTLGGFGGFGLWGAPQPKWQPPKQLEVDKPTEREQDAGILENYSFQL